MNKRWQTWTRKDVPLVNFQLISKLGNAFERHYIGAGLWFAKCGPSLNKRAPLFELVATPVGCFRLVANAMCQCVFTRFMRKACLLARPVSKRTSETVDGNSRLSHISHGNAIRAVDSASGYEFGSDAFYFCNDDLRASPISEFQFVGRTEILHPFGNCVERDDAATFLETFNFGNCEAAYERA